MIMLMLHWQRPFQDEVIAQIKDPKCYINEMRKRESK